MSENNQKNLPPVLERYELKYMIPFDYVEQISSFVKPYCSMDKYSEITPGNFYRVNNLYLDSPKFSFLKNRIEGVNSRFNMRVRAYGEESKLPYFIEIKHKRGNLVKKYRAKINHSSWYKAYSEAGFVGKEESDDLKETKNKELFERLVYTYNASPKILTQYLRKAFISDIDDYARVTFDIDLKYMEENDWNLIPDQSKMINYDHSFSFDENCSVILELKCYTSQVPYWMLDLIREFNLKRISFSKYLSGAKELFGQDRFVALDRALTIA